jgi:integrase
MKYAIDYINHIKNKNLSLNTRRSYLRNLKEFFEWLSDKPSYKSKIKFEDIDLLSISNNETNQVVRKINLDYPTFEQAKQIVESIEVKNEVDKRDKALISFAILTGIRVKALMTLTLGCIDIDKMMVRQFVREGVQTKFRKDIISRIFNFDDNFIKYFLDWYYYLKQEKLFGNEDPLFPKSKQLQTGDNFSFNYDSVSNKFWQSHSSIREIFVQRAKNANIKPFSPHKYRHLSIKLAFDKCQDAKEIKAVSQHFGHEDVSTTIQVYGNYRPEELFEILNRIDNKSYSSDISVEDIELLNQIKKWKSH